MKRTDIHAPSKIIPQDYEYVALCPSGLFSRYADLRDCEFVKREIEAFRTHQAKTGGKYSTHQHGGSCHCCGAFAIYRVIFYHAKTNTYVKLGWICAEKLEMAFDSNNVKAFRKQAKDARQLISGKRKAQAVLSDKGLTAAWGIYQTPATLDQKFEERTIQNIVAGLVRYGNLTEKQEKFLTNLLAQIPQREAKEQRYAQEKALAADAPNGRVKFVGEVVNTKIQDSQFGSQLKMLVKSETGYLAWGTVPADLDNVERGDTVAFEAKFSRTQNDAKFAYFKRPTKALILAKKTVK